MAFMWRQWVFVVAVVTVAASLPTPENNYVVLTGHQVWQAEGGLAAASIVDRLEKEGLADILGHTNIVPMFRVFPESSVTVSTALQQAGIPYRVLIPDLGRHIAEEPRRVRRDAPDPKEAETCNKDACPKPFTDKYMKFEEIEWYLHQLAARSPRVELKSIGKSVEGRDIWRVLIKSPSENKGATRRDAVWLEGGLHAREWIAPAVTLHLIHLIDEMISDNASVMQDLDVYVVPMANPDGYVYSWTTDRLWRKNRRPSLERQDCPGVDLNRNWAVGYTVGASKDPCSVVYMGTQPFSEPETEALKEEMLRVSAPGELKLVMALHSYGQLLAYPWGWTEMAAPNSNNMRKAGMAFVKAAGKEGGRVYRVDNSASGLYLASGATDDWAKGTLETPYAYTLELPDTGIRGFTFPANQILPVVHEVWRGLQDLLPRVRQNNHK